jgi:hypothetical protein
MADASGALRPDLPRAGGLRLETYLGLAGAAAGLIGVVAVFGSVDTAWRYATRFVNALYFFAAIVVG